MAKFDEAVENQEFKKLIRKTNIKQNKYGQLSMAL